MAEDWFLQAPDSRGFFSLLDRNEYILKARVKIMQGELREAQILLGIVYYRMQSSRWRECFTEALKKAEKFGYIRVVADEGAAVLPLFDNILPKDKRQLGKAWYGRLEKAVREMAAYYPDYLQIRKLERITLTKTEKKVLGYLCGGMDSKEICERMHITYSGLKYHKGNIYRKMGVKNLKEVVSIVKAMGFDEKDSFSRENVSFLKRIKEKNLSFRTGFFLFMTDNILKNKKNKK